MTGYYDIVLGLIPLSLAGLTGLLLVAGMSLSIAIPVASTIAVGLMGHAMFVNGPVGSLTKESTDASTPAANTGFSAD